MIKAVVGANWGDEGKGKITDVCAKDAHIVVRFQGGSNAGHTIINDYGKFALHQLPSGVFYEDVVNVLANGVALNVDYLKKEIESVKSAGINFNLIISDRAHILMPYHVLLDTYEEERLAERQFGSTKSGIAPLYSDKYAKTGIQAWELYSDMLKPKINDIVDKMNIIFKHLYNKQELNKEEIYETLRRYGDYIEKNICDTSSFLRNAINEDRNIFLEGQLGALKDIDHGIYPYVTSSSTLAGYASVGAGIEPYSIKEIIAVTKAYSSAVGEGPFVSELFGEEANTLRLKGGDAGEFGATTGRPRRVGYFDVVATRYGAKLQGATQIALTAIDVLEYMDEIPVCVGYEIDGKVTEEFPTTDKLYRAKPVLKTLKGFRENIRGVTDFNKLPENAKNYVKFIEDALGVKVSIVSTGPKREEIIYRA